MSDIDLTPFLLQLTTEPGVYQMLDVDLTVLYVGKANNLKKRVSQYFSATSKGSKTRALVQQIYSIQVTVTRSETEALLLESTLIKALRPKYNILMRDDKSYPYLHFSEHANYPRMAIIRHKNKPTAGNVFGPYPSAAAVRETFNMIQKTFKIRDCSDQMFNSRKRPCLQYQIQRCSAPCVKKISKDDYATSVAHATRFLQGKSHVILDEFAKKMQQSVASLDFEEAARLRDQIKNLRLAQEQQSMVNVQGDADAVVMDIRPGKVCIQWVSVRDGAVLHAKRFFPDSLTYTIDIDNGEDALWQSLFSAFIGYYYVSDPNRIPAYILTDRPVFEVNLFENLLSELSGKSCKIQSNPRGLKARWLDFAINNLQVSLADHQSHLTLIQTRYAALLTCLNRTEAIKRMECFDISHTQGQDTVASCVVFDSYGPKNSQYRLFNIQGITPGDDLAAMEQVLLRRFKNITDQNRPDLVIIDGGRLQVNVAARVLASLNLQSIFLLGIAKGPTRKAGLEVLIFTDGRSDLTLPSDSPALHLLQHIRDESHRFAITAHRKRRQKSSLQSSLDTIEGIGTKRRQALLMRFGGVKELAKASIDELSKVTGISYALALRIYAHFHTGCA